MTPTLDRAAFTAWLAQFPNEAVVGIAQNPNGCPIANFLESLPAIGEVAVCERYYLVMTNDWPWHTNETRFSMPVWAKAFVELVDGWTEDDVINAGTAREYLARIPVEVA